MNGSTWIKSGRCESHACVEVTVTDDGDVLMRDGKDPNGPVLRFTRDQWAAITASMKTRPSVVVPDPGWPVG